MMRRAKILLAVAIGLASHDTASHDANAAQRLDQAVAEQLTDECTVLLGEGEAEEMGAINQLEGELQAFCELGHGDVPPIGAASGGGAATSATAPGIIQQQQRERLLAAAAHGGDTMAASGDVARTVLGDRFSFFVLGNYAAIDKDRNNFEDGYDSDVLGATAGGSYRIRPNAVAGLAFDYFHEDGNYDEGGDFDTDSFGAVAFGAVSSAHLIVQGSAGYARRHYERTRPIHVTVEDGDPITGQAPGDYDGNAYFLEVAATSVWRWREVTLSPFASLGWSRIDYDSYEEKGDATGFELRFHDDHQTFLLSALGAGASTVFSTGAVALVPSVDISWLHEFENDQRTVKVSFVDDTRPQTFTFSTEKPDRNFGMLRASLAAVLPNGLRPFVQFQTVFENTNYSGYLATIGLNFDL